MLNEAYSVHNESNEAKRKGLLEQAQHRIFKSFCEVDYKEFDVKEIDPNYKMNFSVSIINDVDFKVINDYRMNKQGLEKYPEGVYPIINDVKSVLNPEYFKTPYPKGWISVRGLTYEILGKRINVSELLPEHYNLLVFPKSDNHHGSVYHNTRRIVVEGDLASIGTLAILLHEIGHAHDLDRLEELGLDKMTEGGFDFEDSNAEILRKERTASLFALRKMWPIIRQDSQLKSDVILELKDYAYSSYCSGSIDAMNARYDTFDEFDDFSDDELE